MRKLHNIEVRGLRRRINMAASFPSDKEFVLVQSPNTNLPEMMSSAAAVVVAALLVVAQVRLSRGRVAGPRLLKKSGNRMEWNGTGK